MTTGLRISCASASATADHDIRQPLQAKVDIKEMLTRGAALAYNAKRTGEKYLVVPNG